MGLLWRAPSDQHRDRPSREERPGPDDGRSVRRRQGAHRRVHDHQGRRSRRGAEVGREARTRNDPADRSAAVPALMDTERMCSRLLEIERVFREEYGRAVAVLVRVCGDITLAEEAVQDAFAKAVERWPSTGLPPSPVGWIITTARNGAIDRLRRESQPRRSPRAGRAPVRRPRHRRHERGRGERRPVAIDLHVLPSGARAGHSGRADAAVDGRLDDGGDRARVSRDRSHDGAAPRRARKARFVMPRFRIACRARRICRRVSSPSSRSSISFSMRATRRARASG